MNWRKVFILEQKKPYKMVYNGNFMHRNNSLRMLVATGILCLFYSCTTKYYIQTKPEGAQVFDGDKVVMETPALIDSGQISTETANGRLIKISKQGYRAISVWLPNDGDEHRLVINLNPFYHRTNLRRDAISEEISRDKLYQVADKLLKMQENLFLDLEVNEAELDKMLDLNPTVGTLHYLKATLLLRKGEKEKASLYLRDAYRFSPNQPDFIRLYNEVTHNDATKSQ